MKTYMPLDGFRWSCDSDSALCDIPQTNVLGQAGGSGYTRYNAISKDYKEYITWDDSSGADKRKRYYEIDINELLPKSVENYDFLE